MNKKVNYRWKEIWLAMLALVISKITGTLLVFLVIRFFDLEYTILPAVLITLSVINILLISLMLTYFFKLNGLHLGIFFGILQMVFNLALNVALEQHGYFIKNPSELLTPFIFWWILPILSRSFIGVIVAIIGGLIGNELISRELKDNK